MGYDGKNSIKFHSEPVHDVQLSPFYVNRRPISKEIVGYIKKGKEENGKSKSYHTIVWNDANTIAAKLAEITEFPISLITEAKLEFISTSDSINKMDLEQGEQVLCLDFYAPYFKTSQPQVDPVGPKNGREHVIRLFDAEGPLKHARTNASTPLPGQTIRIVFPAEAVNTE